MNPAAIAKLFDILTKVQGAKEAMGAIGDGMKDIRSIAKALSDAWIEMQDTSFKTARAMNMSREAAMRYNRELMASTRALAVQYGITAENIAEFQKSYANAVGRNIILTKQQTSSIAALSNITDEATAQSLLDEFDKIGVSIDNAFAGTVQIQERAKYLGLNGAKASKTLASNIKLASSYSFRNGVDDIQKMALKAQSLRMDMNAVMSAAEKFMSIESSISTAANIQMLGGSFASNFSNPMAVMYESMADPNALMDRITRTVEGKGTYDRKTGQVTFDPITMMQLREMAKNLGTSVEELTRPAAAKAQNAVVDQEIMRNARLAGLSAEQREAIRNLSRTNVDENTGEHYISYIDENREMQSIKISELTEDQLKIAQDSQLTQDNMWKDVHDIRQFLIDTGQERAKGTVSMKDDIKGFVQWWRGVVSGLEDSYMGPASNGANSVKREFGDTGDLRSLWNFMHGLGHAKGGVIGQKYASGGIVNGFLGGTDKLFSWLTRGEMVLNLSQQKSLFSLIKALGKNAIQMNALNTIGGMVGLDDLGSMLMMKRLGVFGNSGAKGGAGGGVAKTGNMTISAANVVVNGRSVVGKDGKRTLADVIESNKSRGRATGQNGKSAKVKGLKLSGTLNSLGGKNVSRLRNMAKAKNVASAFGRGLGKSVPWIGGALAVGSMFSGMASANENFEKRKERINKMGLSDLGKAKELDDAIKERNRSRGGSIGGAVGAGVGMAVGSLAGPIGMAIGGWLGSKAGSFVGKGIGGLFGGKNEEEYRKAKMTGSTVDGISGVTGNNVLSVLRSINGKLDYGVAISQKSIKAMSLSLPSIGIKAGVESPVIPKPTSGNTMRVTPVEAVAEARSPKPIDIAPKDINLNVSGSIRLESNGNSAYLDVERLLQSSEFVSQLTEIIKKRMNEMSNSSRVKGETHFSL